MTAAGRSFPPCSFATRRSMCWAVSAIGHPSLRITIAICTTPPEMRGRLFPAWRSTATPGLPEPVDSKHVLLAGRANGQIYDGIWLVDLPDLSTRLVGHAFVPTATAPLVHVRSGEWWLIGGEPDSNKNRTPRVAIIRTES